MNSKKIQDLKDKCSTYWRTRALWEEQNPANTKIPIFLDEKKRDAVAGMMRTYEGYTEFHKLLKPEGILESPICGNEKTILLDVEATVEDKEPIILRLKSKLDNYTINVDSNVNSLNITAIPDVSSSNVTIKLFLTCSNKSVASIINPPK